MGRSAIFPRPKGRGLIEAIVATARRTGPVLFPRPKGRGLIEAPACRPLTQYTSPFPRPKGRGLIEAMSCVFAKICGTHDFHGRKAVASLKLGAGEGTQDGQLYFHGRKAVASLKLGE